MDLDLIFVAGLVVGAFAIPSFVSALSDRKLPIRAIVMLILAAGAIYYANLESPDTYTVDGIDDVVVEVLGHYLN